MIPQAHAIGDVVFPERYVDRWLFNLLFAEVLFAAFDSDQDGFLSHVETQGALKFLVRPPKDGSPKPDVPFAAPPGAYNEAGELRLPKHWFGRLYAGMG